MKTITIDILNNKVVKLLQELELLQLIRLRSEKTETSATTNRTAKYKGAMTKQPLYDIEIQLNDLRHGWE